MFNVGDKIVYPMYGAGIIEDLEDKKVEGKVEQYYVIRMPIGSLKIMVSVKKAKDIGLREVSTADETIEVLNSIANKSTKMSENWNIRYKENLEKIRTGALAEVAEVAKNLTLRKKERGLSSVEKKMLSNSKQIILSELILSHNIEKDQAEELMSKELFFV